jgi:multiple sugar transport system permease protein/raffinose/stachyose/melibiose transport system permease protein
VTITAPEFQPRAVARKRRATKRRIRNALLFVVMSIIAVVMLFPFYYMINTSLKSNEQFLNGGGRSFDSWIKLNHNLPWARELLNSSIVCAGAIAIILVVSTMAGFGFAKLHFNRQAFLFLGIIAAMLIPMQSIIIPAFVNLSRLHILNTYLGAILVYAALGTPFATFLMTAYFRGLPDDVIEAGIIDGLKYGAIFTRIALPMAVPAIVTIVVLQFIQIWDDLLVGLLFLQNTDQRTITVGLGVLASGRTTDIPVLMAGSLLSALPAIIVFLIFQRFLINGLTAGIGK